MLRLQGGYIYGWGSDGLRMLDHFQMGPNLVRGFAPSGIGPRDLTHSGTTGDALGGSMYWGASVEFQTPLFFAPKEVGIKLAVFADAGSLWNYQGPTSWLPPLPGATGEVLTAVEQQHVRQFVGGRGLAVGVAVRAAALRPRLSDHQAVVRSHPVSSVSAAGRHSRLRAAVARTQSELHERAILFSEAKGNSRSARSQNSPAPSPRGTSDPERRDHRHCHARSGGPRIWRFWITRKYRRAGRAIQRRRRLPDQPAARPTHVPAQRRTLVAKEPFHAFVAVGPRAVSRCAASVVAVSRGAAGVAPGAVVHPTRAAGKRRDRRSRRGHRGRRGDRLGNRDRRQCRHRRQCSHRPRLLDRAERLDRSCADRRPRDHPCRAA